MFYMADILDAIQVKLDTKLHRPAAMAIAAKDKLNKVNIQGYIIDEVWGMMSKLFIFEALQLQQHLSKKDW